MLEWIRNVLLVEDDPAVAEMISDQLSIAGISTITAFTVHDAIRIIDEDANSRLTYGIENSGDSMLDDCCDESSHVYGFSGSKVFKKPNIFDVILLDGSLHSKNDGLAVLARVKFHKTTAPVIAISGNPESNKLLCNNGARLAVRKTQTSAILGAVLTVR